MKHIPRKRFGQHFLADGGIIDAIVRAIDPKPGEAMVEIGPGLAALTQPLVERLGRLTVIELDRDLAARLRGHSQLHVIEADVLKVDFAAIAAETGLDPLDAMLDIALADGLATVFTAQLLNSDEEAVGRMLNHPDSIVSLSDAGAHLTFFNDAGFGLHLLGHWVREVGAMSLPEAVRRLTSHPASVLGLEGRGRIAAGGAADLLLFDPATVGRGPKRRVHDLPAGAARLTTDALGVHGVWVNGVQVADANGLLDTPPLAGELLTQFG